MVKKIAKGIGILFFIILLIIAVSNVYNWIVSGNQYIKISTSNKAYTNNDFNISIVAQQNGVDLDSKIKLKLLNSKKKKVKNVDIKYDPNNATLKIPDIEPGNYWIEAKVSSKVGKDTVQKEIYISNGNNENVTITLDKGIYKPGDTVNYRVLLTKKDNDEPVSKDVNIYIYDGNNNRVYKESIKSSDYGIIGGNFKLADEVNSGIYKLTVKTDTNETTKQFKVNPYITPKYELKINYDKENYLVGDTAKINISSKYFFGEAVQNADYSVYINNEKYKEIKSDNEGNATIEYEIKNAQIYNVKVEAKDLSNYFVEEKSTFTAGTDLFEIKMYPEYGTLVAGKKNNVYVFTNKADGTPLKTYVTIYTQNFRKQIATDENGIGKFSIDIDDLAVSSSKYYNYNNSKSFSVTAEDMEKNKINKSISLDVEQKDLLFETDKLKYNQGEDIKLNISSVTDNAKNIYFFKNDKLIKMINTNLSDTTVNLDDTYGLIDIYITDKLTGNSPLYKYNSRTSNKYEFKRTIFINPTKQLKIDIKTDKEEYKPGEKISITFNVSNEENSNVDSALLVSMLDNSILKMADNDLSIDNIKMALKDIKLSNELDAATLYSSIIDDSSEQTMMALLLKQENNNFGISETGMYNKESKTKSSIISIVSLSIIVVIFIIVLCIKFKRFRRVMKHVFNFIIYAFVLQISTNSIIDEWFTNIDLSWWIASIIGIISLATYISAVYKLNKKIFRTSLSIYIALTTIILVRVLIELLSIPVAVYVFIIAIILLILIIIAKICDAKKLKINKYTKPILKEIIYILKFGVVVVVSGIIANIFYKIIDVEGLGITVFLILIYVLNYAFNNLNKERIKEQYKQKKENIKYYILIVLAIIGIMAIGYIVLNSINEAQKEKQRLSTPVQTRQYPSNPGKIPIVDHSAGIAPTNSVSNDTSKSNGVLSLFDAIDEFTSIGEDVQANNESANINNEQTEIVTDNKVRNVFLESMCFIPELEAKSGNVKLDLDLSDNITTWTIQTVGNTKDGRIGYGILDTVKVFKEFFVEFELPKNLIETDNVSIPVTVHNYTESEINTSLKIKEEDWFILGSNNINISIPAKSSKMVYVPIKVLKTGKSKFRVEVTSNNLTDIVEKECTVSTKGYKIEKVVSNGNLEKDISEDILFLEDVINNTAKAKVKIYSSTVSQAIEGMENIFRMPTGCFEQISSSLYPNILALKYLEDNKISNDQIREKAKMYISSGYQKLLTYEVKGENGGYSLYGHYPAETVLTAYGLMEVTDLSKVYNVDKSVIENMTNFLYNKQNINGTFKITGNHLGGANNTSEVSLNAYITWALSESNPNDERLKKSVEYLKNKLKDINDNYTLALIANALVNVKDKDVNDVLKRLVNNINTNGNIAYLESKFTDYYGTRGSVQTVQTVALTSMALSKSSYNQEANKKLINYIISKKDKNGTWYSTQATILALKALNIRNEKQELKNQTIKVKVNSDEKQIEIKDNSLQVYEITFDNLNKENKLSIDIEKGNAYYEVIEEYYIPYENVNTQNDNIEVKLECNKELSVNEILQANLKVTNRSGQNIANGMVTISIPQGFYVIEESLMELQNNGIIEKYEMSYNSINIYLRNFEQNQELEMQIKFRAGYPVDITGLEIKVYDYYNPDIEGKTLPVNVKVK